MSVVRRSIVLAVACAWIALAAVTANAAEPQAKPGGSPSDLLAGKFSWTVGPPLVSPAERPSDPCVSIKDPTIVQYNGKWHLFCTIRSKVRTHQIEYLSFADWKDANAAQRHVMKITDDYYCAPQVFYFTPQKKWYMLYQMPDENKKHLTPAFSTTANIDDPYSWSGPQRFYEKQLENWPGGIDFWVICDETRAHLFFTDLKGNMWRAETRLADFPKGWTEPKKALTADIFEASHTYRLKGLNKYLTLVEAQTGTQPGWRYYKAYLADRLDGEWKPLADTREKPFAGAANVRDTAGHWTDSISHGELLRDGYDEKLEVDPNNLRFLFQGVTDQRRTVAYGEIPGQLGILEPAGKSR